MTSFNLSAWAIANRSVVLFLIMVLVALGLGSYMQLGRNEDPTFTIKTMVLQAKWPGATLDDMLNQVTERLERKLQETPHLDYLKSYTKAGESTVFVYLQGSTGPEEVEDTWYQVRKKVDDIKLTLPQGVIGPLADDEFGDTYGIIYGFTADGFTNRELRDYVEDIRSRLLQVPDVAKVNLIGTQPDHHKRRGNQAPGERISAVGARHPRGQLRSRRPHHPSGRHRRGPPRRRRAAGADLSCQRQARPRRCGLDARRWRCPGTRRAHP
jgi:hypothetical protein